MDQADPRPGAAVGAGGVARELSPATSDLAKTIDGTLQLLPQADLLSKCVTKVILPTGDIVIQDGALSTGKENYRSSGTPWSASPGRARTSTATACTCAFSRAAASRRSDRQGHAGGRGALRPQRPRADRQPAEVSGQRPPYRPDVPCYTQKVPDLHGAATGRPDTSTESTPPTLGDPTGTVAPLVGTVGDILNGLTRRSSRWPTRPCRRARSAGSPRRPATRSRRSPGALPSGRSASRRAAARRAAARRRSAGCGRHALGSRISRDDVAGQLLDRLNPFRAAGLGRTASKTGRGG